MKLRDLRKLVEDFDLLDDNIEVGIEYELHFYTKLTPTIKFVEGEYLSDRWNPRIYDKKGKFFGANFDTPVIVIGKIEK